MENKSEYYYEKIADTLTPGSELAKYYCSLYGIDVTKSETIMFNRLVGVFGRFNVFFAVSKMVGTYPKVQDNPYPLLHAICVGRFEEAHLEDSLQSRVSLNRYIQNLQKDIEEYKKTTVKIPPLEGDDKGGE